MTDSVLLTGISGYLGSHVALQLLKGGYKVRGSLRSPNRADEVRATMKRHGADTGNLEFVTLDLLSNDGWDDAMKGVRYVQHTASPFITRMPADKMELIAPAVEGTKRAMNSALKADVEHVVLTSSMAAIMYGHERTRTTPFTEDDWSNINSPDANAYTQSKTLAERAAWELIEDAGRKDDLRVINPSFIMGPLLNADPGTSGAIILRLLKGQMPAAPRLSFPCVDVRDVAALHIMAMTSTKAAGSRLATSADNLTLLEIAGALKDQLPAYAKKLPRFELPDWIVRIAARFDADARGSIAELGHRRTVDARRARALLGRDFIAPREAVAQIGQSLVNYGLA